MNTLILLGLGFFQGTYFSNARTYDATSHQLRENMHIYVGESGKLEAVGLAPIKVPADTERIDQALVLPHYADFYLLLQERGLGMDEDISVENQKRMAETLRQLGIDRFRDPVFPPAAVSVAFENFQPLAQRGYITLQGAQGASFGMVVDPALPMDQNLARLPATGPVTLWWTTYGSGGMLKWQSHLPWVAEFINALHQNKRKVGAFIEGARDSDLRLLAGLALDFLEGVPDDSTYLQPKHFPGTVWVPLLALNDKRHCAKDLHNRLIPLRQLKLYDLATIRRARDMSRQVAAQLADRCRVWEKRRPAILSDARAWVQGGNRLGVGSAGGHPFSFTGELRPEIDALRQAGLSDEQLLQTLFHTTPGLLGPQESYLAVGKPAHFIVYKNGTAGLEVLGTPVDLNYSRGQVMPQVWPAP